MSILVSKPSLVPLFIVLSTLLTKIEFINTKLGIYSGKIYDFVIGLSSVISLIISNIDMFNKNPHLIDSLLIVETISVGTLFGIMTRKMSPLKTIIEMLIITLAFMSLYLLSYLPVKIDPKLVSLSSLSTPPSNLTFNAPIPCGSELLTTLPILIRLILLPLLSPFIKSVIILLYVF